MDTTGNLTIGYGHNLAKLILPTGVSFKNVRIAPVNGIPRIIGEYLLTSEVVDVMGALSERLPFWKALDNVRRLVLADMAFNMGVPGLVNGWPNFLRAVGRGDYTAASDTMLGSKWRRQVGDRAVKLAAMMRDGADVPA